MKDIFAGLSVVAVLAVIAAVVAVGVWYFGLLALQVATDAECLRAGYRDSSISWKWERYCVRRVDQTDQVVPLSEVKR